MKPIVCYSASKQKHWAVRLKTSIEGFACGAIDHFCVVTTNATFSGDFFQTEVDIISGVIAEVIEIANPQTPFKLRRTTWKRPDLWFVVEEIRGQYAYGYILSGGAVERKASYPINNEKLQWFFYDA